MSRFISLSKFKSLYTDHSQLLTEEGFLLFSNRLNSEEGSAIAATNNIANAELLAFSDSLLNKQHILFHGWVEQNTELLNYLEKGEITGSFEDKKLHLKHRWGVDFITFISPYIESRLLAESTNDFKKLECLFSLTQLIIKDNQALVETQLFKPIVRLLEEVKNSFIIAEEQDLINLVRPVCSDEIIKIINHLSKRSYSLKLEYVDTVLETINAQGCTVRFANWVLKKMEELDLNEEHKLKIKSLREEVKTGSLKVRNHGEGRTPIRWKTVITLTIILGLLGSMFYIIYYKPFNSVGERELAKNASFKQFSVEERKSIDSLIKVMNNKDFTGDHEVDPGVFAQGGGAIQVRSNFKNSLMDRIYSDLSKDAAIKEYYASDSCSSPIKFERYSGVKNLLDKKGTINTIIRNDSEYDIIVYVSSNSNAGSVYSMLVKKEELITFKMNQYDIITTVAGNEFQNFEAPEGLLDEEIPSVSFKRHFCNTDANYLESIDNPQQLLHVGGGKAKFSIRGTINGPYDVIDLYDVMEDY